MALAALSSNKLRAMLTTLGVVIGITTVLLMGWFLAGLDNALEQTLSIFGDDILYIDKYDWTGGNWMENRNRPNITYDQFLKVRERIQTAEVVVPTVRRGTEKVQYGDLQLVDMVLMGVGVDYGPIIGNAISDGRFFNETEDNTGAAVAVIAKNLTDNLFPNIDPIGRKIKIDGLPFTVIGTIAKRGSLGFDNVDDQIFIPIKKFFSVYGNSSRVVITVKAGGVDKLEDVTYETIGVMRQVRSLGPGEKDNFAVNTQQAFRDQSAQLRTIVFGVGIAMTGLSFLVGSIGIMNIMFVSVTERTKEIGIRKALGATRKSILAQFLVEAVALCMVGSVIAFLVTALFAWLGSIWLKDQFDITFLSSTVPLSQIVVAIVVSVIVGILAGILPAYRGARMDPVDALRAE